MPMASGDASGDQVLFATGGYDHTIRFWAAYNGQCQRIVQHADSQVNAMEITPDRTFLAAAGFQHIRMYDIPGATNSSPVINYEAFSKNVTGVGFAEDGRWIFSSGEDGAIKIFDMRSRNTQSCQRSIQTSSPVNCVALHVNQNHIYCGNQNGTIHIWDVRQENSESIQLDVDISVQHLSIEPEGNYLAAVDNKGSCYMMGIKSVQESHNIQRRLKLCAHKRYALKCRFSPDSTLLVTTSADQTAKIWRTADLLPLIDQSDSKDNANVAWPTSENLSPLVALRDSTQRWVWDVSFSNDSQYVITGSSDNLARLWSINTGDIKREYSGHQKAITAIAFSDGASS